MPPRRASSPVVAIVDDDAPVCRALGVLVESAGYRVRCFTSGREFLDDVAASGAGCAVLDVKMPGLDGPEVMAALRRMGMGLPVIFVTAHDSPALRTQLLMGGRRARLPSAAAFTAHDSPALRTQLLMGGGRACFGKPVDPPTLVAAVRACLEERSCPEEPSCPLPS